MYTILVMKERRRHVRAKPTPELPSHVVRQIAVGIAETVDVVDISVSGLAVAMTLSGPPPKEMKLRLVIGETGYDLDSDVRWSAKGMVGLELKDPPVDTTKVIARYVSELLERGGRA